MAHHSTYATKASITTPLDNPIGGKPVFIKHKDIPSHDERPTTNGDVYKCLLRVIPANQIRGIQKIGGLWRIYIESQSARIQLITNGLDFRNVNIAVYDSNPFIIDGKENCLRLLIKDVPLSVHDTMIINELEKKKSTKWLEMLYANDFE